MVIFGRIQVENGSVKISYCKGVFTRFWVGRVQQMDRVAHGKVRKTFPRLSPREKTLIHCIWPAHHLEHLEH